MTATQSRLAGSDLLVHLRRARDHTFEEPSAKRVAFLQEPSERPYGVEAVMRDVSGNRLVLVEPRAFTPADVS